MKRNIQIDLEAGPCFGVQRAIQMAEDVLNGQDHLACLGDLIHNDEEIRRLESKGMRIVSHCQIVEQSGKKILLRAHGEPPSTFRIASNYDVEVINATCPIVNRLQKLVDEACKRMVDQKGQVILFGEIYHAEMIALKGYCSGEFHIVRDVVDVNILNPAKPTVFFSQTTKYKTEYSKIVRAFEQKRKKDKALDYPFEVVESICNHVAIRDVQLTEFLSDKDLLIFVSGRNSSNGKYLFNVGMKKVKKAYFISKPDELQKTWFKNKRKIGISGATSTPLWLLNEIQEHIKELLE